MFTVHNVYVNNGIHPQNDFQKDIFYDNNYHGFK